MAYTSFIERLLAAPNDATARRLLGAMGAGTSTDGISEGSTNLYFTDARARAAAVADAIADGVLDVAPSQNAVRDALALKLDDSQASVFGLSLLDDPSAADARVTLGLGNVNNTSDADKPISTATQAALDAKLDDSQASAFGLSLLDDANIAAARVTLGNTRKTLAAALSSTVTTATLITDGTTPWQHAVTAGKSYRFTIFGAYQTVATTTGAKLAVSSSGGAVGTIAGEAWGAIAQAAAATGLTATVYSYAGAAGSFILTTGVSVIDSPHNIGMDFVFNCTTSGTLAFYWYTEVAGSAAQLNAGSTLLIEEI